MALPGAPRAWLGAVADGWEPVEHSFDPPVCNTEDPLVRVEIESLPTGGNEQRGLLTRALGRVVNVFGTTAPLHLPAHNRLAYGTGVLRKDGRERVPVLGREVASYPHGKPPWSSAVRRLRQEPYDLAGMVSPSSTPLAAT